MGKIFLEEANMCAEPEQKAEYYSTYKNKAIKIDTLEELKGLYQEDLTQVIEDAIVEMHVETEEDVLDLASVGDLPHVYEIAIEAIDAIKEDARKYAYSSVEYVEEDRFRRHFNIYIASKNKNGTDLDSLIYNHFYNKYMKMVRGHVYDVSWRTRKARENFELLKNGD